MIRAVGSLLRMALWDPLWRMLIEDGRGWETTQAKGC